MPVAAVTYDFLSPGRTAAKGATVRVHAALREAIVQLDLKPGEYLDKQAIAARMGVSRFPVGEAMNRLAAEGLVDAPGVEDTLVGPRSDDQSGRGDGCWRCR